MSTPTDSAFQTHNTIPTEVNDDSAAAANPSGKVYLIGAGPGDPELMTVKGLRYLRSADVVLYDRLINPNLLKEARPDANLIYVGKGPGCHTMPQEQINTILVNQALQGLTVARLKGGIPLFLGVVVKRRWH
ncbi:hypothetical protein KDK_36520 [Dictyobacter kobayashii]|uniref:uroporphyrinogen-III C-methyltransferase n=1 Tax=Dictyobacter kobayashii TaxID=2014872 RepID=A0A402AL37_9CHLR|nr:SAM-dependent methyltransferase [Dictyobacter kobayashii]GCE19852.1 hypothetical protein KDK_36520 [Dictyobacter kobayashii]